MEATLEDDWGDLAAPAGATVETWDLDGGVHATYGPRALWTGPAPADALPEPAEEPAEWKQAEWSLSRGIHKDPIHVEFLGPSGRVPEEFLDFGPVAAGQGVHVRAIVEAERPIATYLAVGAAAAKYAWLDHRPVALTSRGYLTTGAVELPAGRVVLDLRLVATEESRRAPRALRVRRRRRRLPAARVAAAGPSGHEELGRRVHDARLGPRRARERRGARRRQWPVPRARRRA